MTWFTSCLHSWNKSAVLRPGDAAAQPEHYYCSRCGAHAILTTRGFGIVDEFGVIKPQ